MSGKRRKKVEYLIRGNIRAKEFETRRYSIKKYNY